jgi:hypothetical protein
MGGDQAVSYRCTLLNAGGSPDASVAPMTTQNTSCALAAVAGSTYSVRVETINHKGAVAAAPSAAVTARQAPGAVQALAVTATGQDRQLKVAFSPPSSDGCNGHCTLAYEYSLDGGGWASIAGSGALISVPSNGVQYTIAVRANNSMEGPGTGLPGAQQSVVAPVAFGPPSIDPLTTGSPSWTQVTFNWRGVANGKPVTVYAQINGGSWQPVGSTGSATGAVSGTISQGSNYNQTFTVSVKACYDPSTCAQSGAVSASTHIERDGTVNGSRPLAGPINPGIHSQTNVASSTLAVPNNGTTLQAFCWAAGEAITSGNNQISSDDTITVNSRIWFYVNYGGTFGYISDTWFVRVLTASGNGQANAPSPTAGAWYYGLPPC